MASKIARRRRIAAGKRDSRRHSTAYAPTAHRRAQTQQRPRIDLTYPPAALRLSPLPLQIGEGRGKSIAGVRRAVGTCRDTSQGEPQIYKRLRIALPYCTYGDAPYPKFPKSKANVIYSFFPGLTLQVDEVQTNKRDKGFLSCHPKD